MNYKEPTESLGVQMASEQRDLAFEENEHLRARLAETEAERDRLVERERIVNEWGTAELRGLRTRAEAAEARLAEAWDQGYADAIDDYGCDIPWGGTTSDRNPYRPHRFHQVVDDDRCWCGSPVDAPIHADGRGDHRGV